MTKKRQTNEVRDEDKDMMTTRLPQHVRATDTHIFNVHEAELRTGSRHTEKEKDLLEHGS